MRHLIITGSEGLVGQHICKKLEQISDIKVTKVKFDRVPLNTPDADYIIHCAGYGQPLKFTKDKIATIRVNTETTVKLFTWLKPKGKFLFVSTSEVYSGAMPLYEETDIGTTTPQHPRACYIEGKRCGEAVCMSYREQGYDVKIARLALAYGEGTRAGDTRVINQLIEQALTKGEINLLDKGDAKRTYCYVEDVADMMLDILFKGTQPVYNVGGQSSITIRDLAYKIGNMTDANVYLGDKGLNGAPEDVGLSLALIQTEFPRTFITLEEGLKKTIDYQRALYA